MFTMDFSTMVANLAAIAAANGPALKLLWAFCWFMAAVLIYLALMQLRDVAESRNGTTMKTPVMTLLAASLLATAPSMAQTVMTSVYGNTDSPLSYAGPAQANNPSIYMVMQIVSMIGYFFFVRGIFELKHAGEPQRHRDASVTKAITILVSAMAAIYIDMTLSIVGSIFGWNVSNYVSP